MRLLQLAVFEVYDHRQNIEISIKIRLKIKDAQALIILKYYELPREHSPRTDATSEEQSSLLV